MMSNGISEHRKKIDHLDAEILELIQQRVAEAVHIRKLKKEQQIPLFTPEREQELIKSLIQQSSGRLADSVIRDIWNAIIQGGKQTKESQ